MKNLENLTAAQIRFITNVKKNITYGYMSSRTEKRTYEILEEKGLIKRNNKGNWIMIEEKKNISDFRIAKGVGLNVYNFTK